MKQTRPAYQTTRIWVQTLALLRLIRAHTGESQVAIMERLARAEAHRLHGQHLPSMTSQHATGGRGEA